MIAGILRDVDGAAVAESEKLNGRGPKLISSRRRPGRQTASIFNNPDLHSARLQSLRSLFTELLASKRLLSRQ